MQGTE